MKILIACEESQAVCKEMRRLGHEAYSIKAGDRIGQGMLVNYIPIGESTDRIRIGGFGSTGK